MARSDVLLLALLSAFLCTAAAICQGAYNFNETFARRRLSEVYIDCHVAITVDTSHCGFTYTPQYNIPNDGSSYFDCSDIVNPGPTSFELRCTFDSGDLVFGGIGGGVTISGADPPARRMSAGDVLGLGVDEDFVISWQAQESPLEQECDDTIDNLTRTIADLENTIDDLRTTLTQTTASATATSGTTSGSTTSATQTTTSATSDTETTTSETESSTTVSETSTTPNNATTTQSTVSLTTPTTTTLITATSLTATSLTATTQTATSTTTNAPAVLAAGASTECDSLLVYLIIAVAFDVLFLIIIICLLARRRRETAPSQTPLNSQTLEPPLEFDADAGMAARSADPSQNAASAAPSSFVTGSVGSGAGANGVNSGGQQSVGSWAARSIIYRYLRRGPRSGNQIEAVSRRGWKMNAKEPPNMEDPESAAPSAANSRAPSQMGGASKRVGFSQGVDASLAGLSVGSGSAGAGSVGAGSVGAGGMGAGQVAPIMNHGAVMNEDGVNV